MKDLSHTQEQIQYVSTFEDLVSIPFKGNINALCWDRKLKGDFSEIVDKVRLDGNITTIDQDDLAALQLSQEGDIARNILLSDWEALEAHGASPILNIIKSYDRDDSYPFFPTDVYSFHVDRSPIPVDTLLCTYHGTSSEILPNKQGTKKILIPEIRAELRKLYDGKEAGFDSFLSDNFFDLHYEASPQAEPTSLGIGNLWRLAIDHPKSKVPPCLHRAPKEKPGQHRLLMIC